MAGRYDLVLIDADDTLFDFQRCEEEALRKTLAEAGIQDGRAAPLYKEINARAWAAVEAGTRTRDEIKTWRFAELLGALGVAGGPGGPLDPESVGESYLDKLSREAWLLEGAVECCQALRGKARLVLVTNGITRVQKGRLARSPLGSAFDAVVISEEAGYAKPDPRVFALGASLAGGCEPSRALVVGDSLSSDIAGGFAWGADTCWFNPKGLSPAPGQPAGRRPTHIVHSLLELPALLD